MRTRYLTALVIGLALPSLTLAWTAPTASPPGNNVASPINTGATSQLKNGTLGVNGLGVFGNTILNGTNGDGTGNGVNSYLNFGATSGQNGYGVRDNNGILEFKNLSGSWGSFNVTLINLMTVNGITPNGLGQITSIKFGDGTTQTTAAGANPWSTNGTNIYYNGGNVGIGIQSPQTMLHLQSSTSTVIRLSSDASHFSTLQLYTGNAPGWALAKEGYGGTGSFYIDYDDQPGKAKFTALAITPSGNVGINTVSPQSSLHIYSAAQTNMTDPVSGVPAGIIGNMWIFPNDGAGNWTGGGDITFDGGGDGVFSFQNKGLSTGRTDFNTASVSSALSIMNSSGNVGINTNNPKTKLDLNGSMTIRNELHFVDENTGNGISQQFNIVNWDGALSINNVTSGYAYQSNRFSLDAGGNATFSGSVSASYFYQSSDIHLKTNVQTFPNALQVVKQLRGATFNWKKDGTPSAGVIAQEVEKVMPSAVKTNADGMKSVDYNQFVAPLIEAVKDIASLSDTFKTTLTAWLGSAENGIDKIVTRTVETNELCITSGTTKTCITQQQLAALLASRTTCQTK